MGRQDSLRIRRSYISLELLNKIEKRSGKQTTDITSESRRQPYADRREGGRSLAVELEQFRSASPLVLALPRGGVPVAYEVATELHAPLDVFAVRKIGAPQQPELGVGAVAVGGLVVLDQSAITQLGISDDVLRQIVARESAEIERQLAHFRANVPLPNIAGRTILLIDDGLATGITASAAIQALRALNPAYIVLAAPVGAPQTVEWLRTRADTVVVPFVPEDFSAVGLWYANFAQVSDAEVLYLLAAAHVGSKRE